MCAPPFHPCCEAVVQLSMPFCRFIASIEEVISSWVSAGERLSPFNKRSHPDQLYLVKWELRILMLPAFLDAELAELSAQQALQGICNPPGCLQVY